MTQLRSRAVVPSLLVVALLFVGGCGGKDTSVSAQANATPANGSAKTTPKKERPNNNRRDTALGRVCAAQQDVAASLGALLAPTLVIDGHEPTADEWQKAVDQTREFMQGIPQALGSDNQLPSDARQFRDALIAAARQADDFLATVSSSAPVSERHKVYEHVLDDFSFFDDSFAASRQLQNAIRADKTNSCPDLAAENQRRGNG